MASSSICPWRSTRIAPGVLFVWLLCGACSNHSHKTVYPVRGSVFYKGKPAHGALVVFHPEDSSDPRPVKPHGRVQADGTFRLSTYFADDGAPAGRYRVTIHWWENHDDEEQTGKSLLPERYQKPMTSGISATIEPRHNKLKPFHLRS